MSKNAFKCRFDPILTSCSLVLPLLAVPAWAQQADPNAAPSGGQTELEKITVTGSNIRRTDAETPSPVQIITSQDLQNSGYTSIAQVLQQISANNMGSLSQANPGAFGAGGSGIALRGLTVGATLVLIDGHRMASYPLPDDGERDYVDLASIPFDAVDHIEVVKDGASSIYGSDAIAGVVNVILKKTFTGNIVNAETGWAQHGGGRTQHASGTKGWGDLENDGYNAYLSVEYRHQDPVFLSSRSYLTITDWTPYGGQNLTQGVDNTGVLYSPGVYLPGSVTGYLVDPNTALPIHFYPGCSATLQAAGACHYTDGALTISPQTQNIDVLGRFTKALGGDWQMNVAGSIFNSRAEQVGVYNATAPYGFLGINSFNFGPSVTPPKPAYPNNFPFVITVPTNYPGNTSGAPAALVYNFPDVGAQTQVTDTTSFRLVSEIAGSFRGWDLNGALGLTRVETDLTNRGYLSLSGIQDALDNLTYIVGGKNSQAVLNQIAPTEEQQSSNDLYFLDLNAQRELFTLPGGSLQFATGVNLWHRKLDEEFPPSFASGDQPSPIYAFAVGQQTVAAIYGELDATMFKSLEVDLSGRVDHYNTFGTNATPKVGIKYTPIQEVTLRGTYSQGFRAPNIAEIGDAGSTSGVLNPYYDPKLCPNGVQTATATSCLVYFPQQQVASTHLEPEKSSNYTFGAIWEPNRYFNVSADYYNIVLKNQIVAVGLFGQLQVNNPSQYNATIYRDPATGLITYEVYPFLNASRTKTDGIDVDMQGHLDLHDFGKLKADLQYTHMLNYNLTLAGTTYELAGTHGPSFISGDTGTPRDRAVFSLTWDRGPIEIATTVSFTSAISVFDASGGIPDCASALQAEFPNGNPPQQFCKVSSFTEFNLQGNYELSKDLTLHASIINLFDRKAPYDLQTFGSAGNGAPTGGAPYNPALDEDGAIGRFFSIGATYRF